MKISNTSARLKEIMSQKGMRQVDILAAAKPHCDRFGVKLAKNDLSQFVNGKVEPGQEKLTILGLALNVSEAWLMGYDVSPSRDLQAVADKEKTLVNGDEELTEYLEMLKTRPEMRMLFQISKDATKEDVEAAVRVIVAIGKN